MTKQAGHYVEPFQARYWCNKVISCPPYSLILWLIVYSVHRILHCQVMEAGYYILNMVFCMATMDQSLKQNDFSCDSFVSLGLKTNAKNTKATIMTGHKDTLHYIKGKSQGERQNKGKSLVIYVACKYACKL